MRLSRRQERVSCQRVDGQKIRVTLGLVLIANGDRRTSLFVVRRRRGAIGDRGLAPIDP